MHLRDKVDFAAGLMYVAIGAAFAIGALDLRLGTPGRMGPGFFPLTMGSLLALIGIAVTLNAFRPHIEARSLERWDLRRIALILGSVVLFALLVDKAGLVVSVGLLVLISSFASDEFTWKATVLNTVALAVIAPILFVQGLGLMFPIWPPILAH